MVKNTRSNNNCSTEKFTDIIKGVHSQRNDGFVTYNVPKKRERSGTMNSVTLRNWREINLPHCNFLSDSTAHYRFRAHVIDTCRPQTYSFSARSLLCRTRVTLPWPKYRPIQGQYTRALHLKNENETSQVVVGSRGTGGLEMFLIPSPKAKNVMQGENKREIVRFRRWFSSISNPNLLKFSFLRIQANVRKVCIIGSELLTQ